MRTCPAPCTLRVKPRLDPVDPLKTPRHQPKTLAWTSVSRRSKFAQCTFGWTELVNGTTLLSGLTNNARPSPSPTGRTLGLHLVDRTSAAFRRCGKQRTKEEAQSGNATRDALPSRSPQSFQAVVLLEVSINQALNVIIIHVDKTVGST